MIPNALSMAILNTVANKNKSNRRVKGVENISYVSVLYEKITKLPLNYAFMKADLNLKFIISMIHITKTFISNSLKPLNLVMNLNMYLITLIE
jgi:hypothetical protein